MWKIVLNRCMRLRYLKWFCHFAFAMKRFMCLKCSKWFPSVESWFYILCIDIYNGNDMIYWYNNIMIILMSLIRVGESDQSRLEQDFIMNNGIFFSLRVIDRPSITAALWADYAEFYLIIHVFYPYASITLYSGVAFFVRRVGNPTDAYWTW